MDYLMRLLILMLVTFAAWAQNPNTAAFPTTIATDQNLLAAKRISSSTLSASINASTTTVTVASGAQFLNYEVIRIDDEEMLICSIATNTLTICTGARGYNGSTAASHTSGAAVRGVITSWHHNQIAAEIKAIETRLSTRVAQCQDAGASDAYACSVAPPITSYTTGLLVNFKANTANTNASTLNLNSLGAIAIKKWSSATLSDTATGDIGAGQWLTVVYDGTYFQIVGGGGGGGAGDVTTSGTNTMTGYTNFSGGTFRLPETTAASLPAAASNTGKIYLITDAVNSVGCTTGTGGGSQRILCTSNGTYWIPVVFTPSNQTAKGIVTDCTAFGGYCNIYLDPGKMGIEDFCSASSSSPTTYTCSTSSTYAAYTNGALAVFDVGGTACTGSTATTLNINGIGAKRIYRYDGTTDPQSTDCTANANLLIVYDTSLNSSAGGWRIIGGTPGSAGGGTAVEPYTTTFSSVSSKSVTAATHGQGTAPLVACFDNATPRHEFACDVSVAANGDVVATFTAALSGTLEIYGGGGSGDVRTDADNTYTSGTSDFSAVTLRVPSSTTLPATCSVGDSYMDTDATTGQRWYLCESTNTWVQQGGGGGATAVTAASTFGTDNSVLRADGTSRGSQSSSCAIDDTGALTCPSIAATGGGVGILTLTEGTAPGAGASAGQVNIYVDSSTHRLGFHINGGSADKILQSSSLAADFPTLNQNTTGNAATATALAANGTNCSAGQFPLGVDASGSSESCTALPTTISGTSNEITASASTGAITLSLPATIDLGGKTSFEIPNGAAPTVSVFGQIAGDNDLWAAGRGAPVFYDGTAAVALVGVLVSDTPSNGQVPTWNTGGTVTWETPSGSGISGLTTNAIVAAGSSTTVATPSTTSTLDSSGNAVFAGTVTASGFSSGGSAPSITAGTGGIDAYGEGTAPSAGCPAVGVDCWYADSTAHAMKASFNNDTASQIARYADKLSVFAATTSAELAGVLSDETGSGGGFVRATSPTFTTPALGAATATSINGLTITSSTGTLTIANGKTASFSNTMTFTGTDSSSVAFGGGGTVLYSGGALGTPSSGTLTNATGLPIGGITGLGTGVGTWLGTPSSANLASAITDETGSGALAFGTQPSLTRPLLVSTVFASLPAAGTADRTVVVTDCANTSCSSGGGSIVRLLRDTGAAWAVLGDGDSGGSPAFSSITAGTNTAVLIVGTGGSLDVSGSGTINSTSLGGTAASGYALLGSSNTWGDGVKQTFNPNATNAGINVGAVAGDPSAPADGDIWYNSTTTHIRMRDAGVTGGIAMTGGDIDAGSNVVATHFGTTNQTFWSGAGATQTLTFQVTNIDPVLTFTDGVMNLSTGALQVGGTAVALQSRTLTGGAGIAAIGDLSADRTISVDSTEQGFLSSGVLTCGASTNGKMMVHTTPLEYCDNSATPTLRYAAYGSSTGVASSATVLETTRGIYGNNFDGSADLTQVIASTYGGTGNGFTKFTGPTTSEKTFTLPDAAATILTSNAAVTIAQGGTGTGSTLTGLVRGSASAMTAAELSGDVTTSGSNVATIAANAVTSAKMAVVNTRRVCDIAVGDTSGSALTDTQLGPQKRICYLPAAATVQEIDVAADGGTPNVIVAKNVAGTVTNLLSSALATAASGGIACSKTTAVTGIDGATTCSATLQNNTSIAAGSYLELVSGTAGGTAKLMTIHVIYTID